MCVLCMLTRTLNSALTSLYKTLFAFVCCHIEEVFVFNSIELGMDLKRDLWNFICSKFNFSVDIGSKVQNYSLNLKIGEKFHVGLTYFA